MDIQQIRTFLAVAREGSITRASESLSLSQPAVSAQIKAIEDTLGLTLFERTPKGMIVTPEGQRLLAKAEQTLAAHREMLDEAGRLKGRLTGKLRLGATHNSSTVAVARLLALLADRHPELSVTIEHGSSQANLNGIRSGTLDAAFYNEAGEPDLALSTIEVARFSIYLAAPPGLVSTAEELDWQSLAQLPWIYPTSSSCCGQAAENLFRIHQLRPTRLINIDRENLTRSLIAGGTGVGLLHADAANAARANGEVELICEAQKVVRVLFAQRASRAHDPLLSTVSRIVRSAPTE